MAVLNVDRTGGRTTGRLAIFTVPSMRGKSVGKALYEHLRSEIEILRDAIVWTHYPSVSTESHRFFTARGFDPIVDTLRMSYLGPAFQEPNLEARQYSDQDFPEYIGIINEAFASLRREAGLDPIVFPDAAYNDENLRNHILTRCNQIWLFRAEAGLIGLLELDGPIIETTAVRPSFQGRGYGRKIVQFGVNRVLEQCVPEVLLEVGVPNLRTRSLYETLGFRTVRSTRRSRLIVP